MRSKPCRILLVIAALACAVAQTAATAHADTMFWINDSGDSAGSPGIGMLDRVGGTGYIWGRPDGDETLVNLSLNVISDMAVVSLTAIRVVNPHFPDVAITPKDIGRYEHVNLGKIAPETITNFGRFSVAHAMRIGVGIGPFTGAESSPCFRDSNYDATNDAFLIASFDYSAAGDVSSAGLWLQIGALGLNNIGGRSEDVNVVFGSPNDSDLNGETDRERNSATVDAIFVILEPSTLTLAGLALIALVCRQR